MFLFGIWLFACIFLRHKMDLDLVSYFRRFLLILFLFNA